MASGHRNAIEVHGATPGPHRAPEGPRAIRVPFALAQAHSSPASASSDRRSPNRRLRPSAMVAERQLSVHIATASPLAPECAPSRSLPSDLVHALTISSPSAGGSPSHALARHCVRSYLSSSQSRVSGICALGRSDSSDLPHESALTGGRVGCGWSVWKGRWPPRSRASHIPRRLRGDRGWYGLADRSWPDEWGPFAV